MPYPSPMPEYQPLFHQVQNFIADQLNSDPQLSGIGIEFLPESQLDIEYGIKRNLGRQGMVGIVNTLKGQYGGHDQDSCAWEIESEIDVLETPTVRRAWLKQNNLSAGTTVDVLNYIQESLCGPASPTYGKFCPVTQEIGEDNGVVVGKAVVKTFAIADVSACVSGESNWHIRYATEADISALWSAVEELSAEISGGSWRDAIDQLSADVSSISRNVSTLTDRVDSAEEQIENLDDLAVKYTDDDKYLVVLNPRPTWTTSLRINDGSAIGNSQIQFGSGQGRYRNYITRNGMVLGRPEDNENPEDVGDTHVQLGGVHNNADLILGSGIHIISSTEKGKSQILMDEQRLYVVTPEEVSAGQTLKAVQVYDDPPLNAMATRDMKKREEPKWHWEYHSANLPDKTSDLTNDSGFITEDDVADKRDYDDLTYANRSQEAMTRAPTYGIGKMIATPSDGTDPVVMDAFFIHVNPSDPSDSLGSTWYAPSFVFAGTTDGTNFRMVDIGFQALATFTKTQLLAGEVTFTYQDKTWTLTAELGDGMIDWWNININGMDWKTTIYSYDSTTRTAKWRPTQPNSWYVTRTYSTRQTLDSSWQAKLWRGNDGVHEDGLVASFWVGGQYGYGGGVEKTFTYGDNTSFLKIHLMGYPFQSNLGLAERIPQQVGMLKNDIGYITMDGAERSLKTAWRTWEYEPDGLTFTAEEANSTVAMNAVGSAPSVSLEYSIDKGKTWYDFIVSSTGVEGTTVTLANVGDKMMLRAKTTNSGFATGWSDYNKFVMTGKIAASGSVMYLLKNDGELDALSSDYSFVRLFVDCSSLTQAPELPATTLTNACYANMFSGCTSLTQAPELPANVAQNCYYGTFSGCSSLNEIKIAYIGNFSGTGVPTNAFNNWVSGVSASGTFYYNGSDTTRGNSAIPENWTIQSF